MTTSVENNSIFRSFFKKQKLSGPKFIDWYRQLRLVLSTKDKENYLEHPIPEAPVVPPGQQVPPAAAAAHAAWVKGQKKELKAMFSKQVEHELLQTVREFHACKQEEGQSVSSYILKMKSFIDNLEHLGQTVSQNLEASLILVSLSKDYDSFVQNYNMHGMGKTVNELHAMLKLYEDTLPKKDANLALHAMRADLRLLHHLRKITLQRTLFVTNVVKFGTGEGTGLRGSKKLKPSALSLYVGDGHRATVEAIRTYHLELPSGLIIVLNNCQYAPSITRGVISVSRLFDDGFINRFDENNVISVLKNNLVYFMAVSRDGIFEIDMSCSNTNDSSMYSISNKRAKINLDPSLLWHCRLGHISKKRIEKLQHDRLLNSINIESLGKYVSCMSTKMARKPYSHQVERAKDLLGLIHTDEHDIIAHRTPLYTPQHNGVSERRNQTLLDMVRSMMSQTTIPKSFWDYAPETAARILNMVPTKKVDKTPYEIWHGQAPKLSYLKVWDREALIKRDTLTKPNKLDPRSFRCILVGYPKETMGYSFYSPSENKVFVARNAEFFENDLIDLKASGNCMCLYIDAEEHELGDLGEPANYKAALLDLESKKWLDSMNVKMQSMKDNDVWVLVELPPNARTVVYVFKALLVAKGFTQTYRVDYEETFSPVTDIGAIRIFIAIAADRSKRLIGLCQSAYIEKILKRYYMENSKRGTIPMQEKLKLSKSQGTSIPAEKQRMQNVPYASAIGSIMYAVRCTRPDVAFAQNITS
nr:hypothetical protein [Tanacetum cinerariifolium]